MRLTSIKLAGFKSFVDPTSVPLTSNLTGIVGPNGCGKSNIIDSVRWVMGESSARHLRGDTMADVIFNGSSSRKPVAHATIELRFDNSSGKLGGEYAQYNEISIKRQVSRDGQSSYFLNGTRCRRKDITDIFLGTGLGPRSYSIIEQGMISRLIEAKPDELRVFLEEAAGISKYKERRRETETRMRHTRENLDRLNDLREEVGKQLHHLQRQARAAERYKELKEEERRLQAELLALRWSALEEERSAKAGLIQQWETRFEAAVAEQRAIETRIEQLREDHAQAGEVFNKVQGRYYEAGSAIARVEQGIQHNKAIREQKQTDLQEVEHSACEIEVHLDSDQRKLSQIESSMQRDMPQLEAARTEEKGAQERLDKAEEAMQAWQAAWEEFQANAAEKSEQAQVERTRVLHLEDHTDQLHQRIARARGEQKRLSDADLDQEVTVLAGRQEELQQQRDLHGEVLARALTRIGELRDRQAETRKALEEARNELQELRSRHAALEAVQQVALGKAEGVITDWLEARGLEKARRLAEEIQVEPGWERALETVLGHYLGAVCSAGIDELIADLGKLEQGSLILFDTGSGESGDDSQDPPEDLLAKVRGPAPLRSILTGVFAMDDAAGAIQRRHSLKAHESIVTPDGIWMGRDWVRVSRDTENSAGVLSREKELRELHTAMDQQLAVVAKHQQLLESLIEETHASEAERDREQAAAEELNRGLAGVAAERSGKQARLDHVRARKEELEGEIHEIEERLVREQEELAATRHRLQLAVDEMARMNEERDTRTRQRGELRSVLDEARVAAHAGRNRVHEVALRVESLRSSRESITRGLGRMQEQLSRLSSRREELAAAIDASAAPLAALEAELGDLLEKRVSVEKELAAARSQVEAIDSKLRAGEQDRSEAEQAVEQVRTGLESERLGRQENQVRIQTVEEAIQKAGFTPKELHATLPEEATLEDWESRVEGNVRRIQRLGAINLAAIDEFAEQSERKEYLDAQFEDLTESLTTLENAIHKIDRETRSRFKETFDKVNAGLQEKFPRLFGGGRAYMELTGDDLLNTGVAVMARPPGKRNSNIHQLSGGEKALTAVALVFAIFELNPAPFCMLDEVDAPLDDANVGRFCELVAEMSERVQFIVITHNKVTMEMTHQLAGVTMSEPGVSRMVSVDVDEAAQLAAS